MEIDTKLLEREIKQIKIYLERNINKNFISRNVFVLNNLLELYDYVSNPSYYVNLTALKIDNIRNYMNNKCILDLCDMLNDIENSKDIINDSSNNFNNILINNNYDYSYPCNNAKVYSEKEFKDIILSFYNSIGIREYNIAKKYFDESRIQLGSDNFKVTSNDGFFFNNFFNNGGYILLATKRLDTFNLTCLAHELVHAIDFHLCKMPRRLSDKTIKSSLVELPSEFFEILFLDYLKDNYIDNDTSNFLIYDKYNFVLDFKYAFDNYISNIDNDIDITPFGDDIYFNESTNETAYTSFGEYVDPFTGEKINIRDEIIYGLGQLLALNIKSMYYNDKEKTLKNFYNTLSTSDLHSFSENIERLGININDFKKCNLIEKDIIKSLKKTN